MKPHEETGRSDGKRRGPLIAGVLVVLAASCAFLSAEKESTGLSFSHALHVTELELDCSNCHEDAEVHDAPGMPLYDTCAACHDELDEGKAKELCVASLFVGEEYRARRVGQLATEVRFSHLQHVAQDLACTACHADLVASTRIKSKMHLSMAECVACHGQRQVQNECSTCHTEIDQHWLPPNHAHDWEHAHGRCSRNPDGSAQTNCALCHSQSTCSACHLAQPPDDHDHFFRRRGHGLIADADRSRCAACHEPDSCARCHSETRPASHAGAWGNPRDFHCLSCHEPLSQTGCALCHPATPSHALGTPKPSDHHPAMNCRQCHGLSAPLPHVDNGGDCNACHP